MELAEVPYYFPRENEHLVRIAIYKLVKNTQNQIRTRLIVQNLIVRFHCVVFSFIYQFFLIKIMSLHLFLCYDPTGNRTRVYRFSNRRFIHSTTNRLSVTYLQVTYCCNFLCALFADWQ